MIKAIIIDDEQASLNSLKLLLQKKCSGEVDVIASSTSPVEGLAIIQSLKPDLLFLDIEMPGMTGIDLVRSIPDLQAKVVFVTAYDAFAIEAFKVSAIDYLLKPVGTEDMKRVIEKIKTENRSNSSSIAKQLEHLEKVLQSNMHGQDGRIGIGTADKILFINVHEILYCEANGAYTNVFLADGKKLVASKSLGEFESQLHPYKFLRIHHSSLINLNRVKEFQRHDGGYVVMENNKHLEVSQRKRKDFLDAIHDIIV